MSLPEYETERLEALALYRILDTLPEPAFDDLTRLAAQFCGTPIAFISFIDAERQWFKSRLGWDLAEVPRAASFCAQTILGVDVLEIGDATQDPRFAQHPRATGADSWSFYAGVPLRSPDGYNVGTLATADHRPRRLSRQQKEALRILAHQVVTHLELRRHLAELERSLRDEQIAREALRTSEAFYETLVESLPQFIIRKDLEGRFTFANAKFCAALGKPLAQIMGKTDQDFYPKHLAEKYHRDDRRVMATKSAIDTIEANQSPEGGFIFVHVIKTPLLDAEGRVVGIQGIFWDVTERKKIEEQLAYERDLLRSLLESIPDRIYFKDVASRFIRCSHSMARRMGLHDPKDILGKTDFDFHAPEAAREYFEEEQRIVLTGKPLINKLQRTVDPDGLETWTSATKVPVYNRHGTITGLVGISRDITKLKQAEEALEQARDAALEHARVKSEFLANMSHEIRTPMHAVVGMADLLLNTPLAPEQREYVETLRNGIDTLLKLINDILDFSKMEAGKLVIENLDFDLRELVETTVELLAERAHHKGLELACWVAPELKDPVRGDPSRLRQVLINLLSNAVKFTEHGEVVVRVSSEGETPTHLQVRVTVADTGIGIAPAAKDAIFQAFTQADGSTTRKYGGTGLGLAISRQLVELMHGRIGVESETGRGSHFWISLPLEKAARVAMPKEDVDLGLVSSARILVVDDNATCRWILQEHLREWGVRHETASDGIGALAILRQAALDGDPYSVAVLDMQMPGMDGLALARAVKAERLTAQVHLIMMTSMACPLDRGAQQAAGIGSCLVKPIRKCRLSALLAAAATVTASPAVPAQALPASPASPACPAPRQLRLLLAEDNPVNQRLALRQLEKLGYSADAVGNGREVLEALSQRSYDLVLMDCQMPEMDGYEATLRLRQLNPGGASGTLDRPYVIALTANALEGDRARGLAAGMNDYLAKPVRMEDLRQALDRAWQYLAPRLQPSSSADDVLDLSVLASLKELREAGQPDPILELVQLFLKDAKPKIDALAGLAQRHQTEELRAAAHSLKGSSSNLGARRLARLFQELEAAAKLDEWERVNTVLPQVSEEFRQVQERLLAEVSL